ncbi:MAG TPA: GNAT family N-acetyltransferase [Candidatus Eisenbacteria bacterium]
MSRIDVTPCSTLEDLSAALQPIMHYFGGGFGEADLARWSKIIDIPRMHAAREDGQVIGGAGAFTFEMSVPGGTVPSAGVTVVGVLPTHRRRGVLTAMMRAQLDDVHRRGDPVAWLWASEETIYRQFGYGMASLSGEVEIPKSAIAFERNIERRGVTRIVSDEEALEPFASIYERVRREQPGMFSRTADWWKLRRLADTERGRAGGAGMLNRVLLTIDGRPEAYALYRVHQSFEGAATNGFLNVIEAVGATDQATREIWRYLLDLDWVARVKAAQLPVDHPLVFLMARPRHMRMRLSDALWVRLVDVPKALAARRLTPGEAVVIDVRDSFCPWNAGRYRIDGRSVERTEAAPDLSVEVNALGSVYLGGFTFGQLARAGAIEVLRPGGVMRADALFPRERAPWCPEIF